jgi:hypothetical protein
VGKPDGKRPLGGSQLRWEDIKLGIKQIKYDKIHLAEDMAGILNKVINLGSLEHGKFLD